MDGGSGRRPRAAGWLLLGLAGENLPQHFVQRRLELTPLLGPMPLLRMPQRRHARRFLDHDQVRVEVLNPHVFGTHGAGDGLLPDLDHVAGLQRPGLIRTQIAVDLHVPVMDQPLGLRPRILRPPLAQGGNQLAPGQLAGDMIIAEGGLGHDGEFRTAGCATARTRTEPADYCRGSFPRRNASCSALCPGWPPNARSSYKHKAWIAWPLGPISHSRPR